MARKFIANTLEIHRSAVNIDRYWSGQGEVTIGGDTYQGNPGIVEIKQLSLKSGDQDRKMSLTIRAVKASIFNRYIDDIGPAKIIVRWAYRLLESDPWQFIAHIFEGRISGYSLRNGEIVFSIETFLGDIAITRPMVVSYETQQDRFPNDKGMTYLRPLSEKGVS